MRIAWLCSVCVIGSALLAVCGCGHAFPIVTGSGEVIEQEFNVTPFDELEVEATFNVVVHEGDQPELVIRARENLFDYIIAEQREDTVFLSLQPNYTYRDADITAEITVPALKSLKIRGGATAEFDSVSTDTLNVNVAGAAKITGDLDVHELNIDISGAAKVALEALRDTTADKVTINASGACSMDLTDLPAREVEVKGSGACRFRVHALETLVMKLSGVCALQYAGSPPQVKRHTSGAVSVRKLDLSENP